MKLRSRGLDCGGRKLLELSMALSCASWGCSSRKRAELKTASSSLPISPEEGWPSEKAHLQTGGNVKQRIPVEFQSGNSSLRARQRTYNKRALQAILRMTTDIPCVIGDDSSFLD